MMKKFILLSLVAVALTACSIAQTNTFKYPLYVGTNGGTGGSVTLNGSTSGSSTIRVPAAAGTGTIFQLPANNGTDGYVLTTNGAGVLTWQSSAATGLTLNGGTLTLNGADAVVFNTTAATEVSLPASGTLATTQNINDTIDEYFADATVGLAAGDTNTYGGATTRTFVESLFGSGTGMVTQRLPFIIGTTSGAPSASDSTVTHTEFEGNHINLYRDGVLQYQNSTATNTVDGFRLNGSVITVNPVWSTGEQVIIDIMESVLWSSLGFEGEESTLLTGLSGYWKLDETSGTTVNDATGTQNGTTTATVNVTGILGKAYEYDAAADYISIPYNTDISPKGTAFSVSIWFKIDSLPTVTGRGNYLLQVGNTASPYLSHSIEVRNDDNRVYVRSRNTSGTLYYVMTSSTLSVDTWYHVVFVNRGDGQTLQLYLNGSDVSSSADTFSGTVFEGLGISCFGNAYVGAPSSYLDGILDSFGIWSRALTSTEVTELYNSGSGKTYPFN